jgi:hypothetical protein
VRHDEPRDRKISGQNSFAMIQITDLPRLGQLASTTTPTKHRKGFEALKRFASIHSGYWQFTDEIGRAPLEN